MLLPVQRTVRASAQVDETFVPALVTVPNVELLEVGQEWETSTGLFDFTPEDLQSCIASQDDPALRTPVVKLGHVDPRFDGQPSLGRIENLRLTNNNQTLVGDFVAMPLWLAKVLYTAYPRRSIEGQFSYTTRTGNTWQMVLTGVALLGDAYPAIDTLEDIQALWGETTPPLYPVEDVQEIAASGSFFRARKVDDMPNWLRKNGVAAATGSGGTAVEASVSLDTVRRAYYDDPQTGIWWWIREVRINPLTLIVDDDEGGLFEIPVTVDADDNVTFGEATSVKVEYVAASGVPVPALGRGQILASKHNSPEDTGRKARASAKEEEPTPDSSTTTQEGSLMDLTPEELAALGLPADATREQVSAAILGRNETEGTNPGTDGNPASQPETPATDPAAQPTTDPAGGEGEGGDADADTSSAQVTVPEGMVLVDAATLAELKTGVAAANGLVQRQAKADRDAVLDDAIRAGKFPKGRRAHYETMLSADPVGTKALIATMEPGLVPTGERGEQGSTEVSASAEETAYPTGWRKQVDASRKTLGDRVKVVQD